MPRPRACAKRKSLAAACAAASSPLTTRQPAGWTWQRGPQATPPPKERSQPSRPPRNAGDAPERVTSSPGRWIDAACTPVTERATDRGAGGMQLPARPSHRVNCMGPAANGRSPDAPKPQPVLWPKLPPFVTVRGSEQRLHRPNGLTGLALDRPLTDDTHRDSVDPLSTRRSGARRRDRGATLAVNWRGHRMEQPPGQWHALDGGHPICLGNPPTTQHPRAADARRHRAGRSRATRSRSAFMTRAKPGPVGSPSTGRRWIASLAPHLRRCGLRPGHRRGARPRRNARRTHPGLRQHAQPRGTTPEREPPRPPEVLRLRSKVYAGAGCRRLWFGGQQTVRWPRLFSAVAQQ